VVIQEVRPRVLADVQELAHQKSSEAINTLVGIIDKAPPAARVAAANALPLALNCWVYFRRARSDELHQSKREGIHDLHSTANRQRLGKVRPSQLGLAFSQLSSPGEE
jgi:hypothetical protein